MATTEDVLAILRELSKDSRVVVESCAERGKWQLSQVIFYPLVNEGREGYPKGFIRDVRRKLGVPRFVKGSCDISFKERDIYMIGWAEHHDFFVRVNTVAVCQRVGFKTETQKVERIVRPAMKETVEQEVRVPIWNCKPVLKEERTAEKEATR